MSFLHDFDNEFLDMLTYCEEQINKYPEPFRTKGLENLQKHNITKTERTSFICYLLAFWLKDVFGAALETCKAVSTGFMFGMLYFFIQDDILDSPTALNKTEDLLLSNLLMMDFINEYQKLFDSNSPFWKYFKTHIQEWAEFNNWEKKEHWGKFSEFNHADLHKLAGKVAPIKIISEALAIKAGKEELIEPVNQMIDLILISMQMVDDLCDWKKDLAEGNCTYLLSEAMKYHKLTNLSELSEIKVRKALYFGNLVDKIISIIMKIDSEINTIPVDAPYLKNFNNHLIQDCQNVLNKINSNKSRALNGNSINLLNPSEEK